MDAEDVQRQINQTLQHANNEILSSFSELLDSRLADVQKSINENQRCIAKAQGRAERKVKDARRRREKFRETTRPYPKTEPQPNSSNTGIWRSGKCYRCNKRGHWRKDCTEKLEKNKISERLENNNHLIEQAFKVSVASGIVNQPSDKCSSPVGRL